VLIFCEQCSTTYSLDDYLVVPGGVPVQCTRCGHVFMAMPEGSEEQNPLLARNESLAFFSDEKAPSLGATQIFGVSQLAAAAAASAAKSFENAHAEKAAPSAQAARTDLAGIRKSEANEVAYLGASYFKEDLSGSPPVPAASTSSNPLAAASSSPPSAPSLPRKAVAASSTPSARQPLQQTASSVMPHGVEQTVEPSAQNFAAEISSQPDESEQAAKLSDLFLPQQGFTTDLPDYVVDEIRRVEDEQAAQLHQFHQSPEFLRPGRKLWRLVTVFLVLLLVALLLALAGLWLSGYSPQQLLHEAQRFSET